MTTKSNSSLSLFSTCPPGLGDGGCLEATCNSTFVPPAQRIFKPSTAQTCPSCDEGFAGLNCNICNGAGSCAARQKASGRGLSGVDTSTPASAQLVTSNLNHTLACDTQPAPITASYYQCNINQPTFQALFPGTLALTGINVANVPNFTATGMSEWDAQANSSYIAVFLDGQEQFNCQATDCASSNTSTPVGSGKPAHGTSLWSCGQFQCSCVPGTKVCTGSAIPLASIIDSLNGKLDLPCNYVDPTDPEATTECAFSTPMLNNLVGPNGLSLVNCQFGECVPQFQLEQNWQINSAASEAASKNHLSGGVIAGLIVLAVAITTLISVIVFGVILRKRAARRPRQPPTKALGLAWDAISYTAESTTMPRWALRNRSRRPWNSIEKGDGRHVHGWELNELAHSPSEATKDTTPLRQRTILRSVTSLAEPGSLTFIMGPSGSGKTTLVDILAGRSKKGTVQGSLSWLSEDGRQLSALEAQREIALVDQDDSVCLPGYLTVREALKFAATLGAPENVPREEREAVVEDVISTLGLQNVANTRIGDARSRGISGGERRRVSLGVAMVSKPKVLIADECISGLDAVSAYRVVEALRRLASGSLTGTTVILTIHQPSSQIFHMADRAIVLAAGNKIFDGKPSQALDFCASMDQVVPAGYNVADSLLTLAFRDTASTTPAPYSSQYQLDAETTKVDDENKNRSNNDQWVRSALPINHGGDRPVTTFMTQLNVLLSRYALMTRREKAGAIAHIVGSTLVAILVGGCFYQVKLNLGGYQNRVGSMFFIFILILFFDLSAITVFAKTRLLVMRERASGFYSPWSWVASHLVYDLLLLRAIPTMILVVIVYWMVGLRHTAADFFQFLLITVIFGWVVSIYGMSLAALIEDVSIAVLMGALYVLFNLAFAGFIMNHASTPEAVGWLRWLVPIKYALEGVASNELNGLLLVDNIGGVPIKLQVSIFTQKLFGFEPNSYYRDLIVLSCGYLVGLSLMLFFLVWWRMREVR